SQIDDLDFAYNSGRLSGTDKVKLSNWDYPPSADLYNKYKSVYDNPKYYNQSTGAIHWPDGDGFASIPKDMILKPSTRIDRFGSDYGTFTSPEGTPYAQRAVAPGTDSRPYSVFEVLEPLTVKGGEIAPWFDEPGGGMQYMLPDTVDELLDQKILRRISP
ncbi:TNT domain-containing protein, partial [Streptococcus pluranimalium]|uniref:TNT domain-containing protein n=1 Tax=Streptococcus pluranimalium TaxID=82348 RepID=UPI0039FDB96A